MTDAAAALEKLKARFLDRCQERLQRLHALTPILLDGTTRSHQHGNDDTPSGKTSHAAACAHTMEPEQEYLKIVHEMTGGGGTFGCPDLSKISAEFEAYLACCFSGNHRLDDQVAANHMTRLEDEVERSLNAARQHTDA